MSMAAFVKAVDLGSFASAAEALEMSAQMVGKHVRFLEDRLGVRLLNRTTRRQSLTDVGKAYYERCKIVLLEAEAADTLAADQRSEPRGRLRITMPVHFGRECVAPVLLRLAQHHPALELELSFTDRLADLAQDGYDLAVRTGVLSDRSGIIAKRLARQRMIVCAAPAYLREKGAPERVEQIAAHDSVVYRRFGTVAPWLFPRAGRELAEIMPSGRLQFNDLKAIAEAVVAGAGLGWLPTWLVRQQLSDGTLVDVFPHEDGFLYDAYALWLRTPHMPMKLRLAVDELSAALPGMM